MSLPCLIVATGSHWLGAARLPKALATAGFDVALLAPRNSLAGKSRFVGRIGHLPDNANTAQWLFAFAAMAKAVSPRIAIPGDAMSFELMQTLVTSPPGGMQPALLDSLTGLICESLGDPAWYVTSIDRTRRARAAADLGIEVAADPAAVLSAPSARDSESRGVSYVAAAWNGELLAGWTAETIVAGTDPEATPTVVRRYGDTLVRDTARKLISAFGMSGLVSIDFHVDPATRRLLLADISRGAPPAAHQGAKIRVDLCAALAAAIEARPSPTRADLDDGEESHAVMFPHEWLRDPNSVWLKKCPVDVPWDEPELFEAMLALRQG